MTPTGPLDDLPPRAGDTGHPDDEYDPECPACQAQHVATPPSDLPGLVETAAVGDPAHPYRSEKPDLRAADQELQHAHAALTAAGVLYLGQSVAERVESLAQDRDEHAERGHELRRRLDAERGWSKDALAAARDEARAERGKAGRMLDVVTAERDAYAKAGQDFANRAATAERAIERLTEERDGWKASAQSNSALAAGQARQLDEVSAALSAAGEGEGWPRRTLVERVRALAEERDDSERERIAASVGLGSTEVDALRHALADVRRELAEARRELAEARDAAEDARARNAALCEAVQAMARACQP